MDHSGVFCAMFARLSTDEISPELSTICSIGLSNSLKLAKRHVAQGGTDVPEYPHALQLRTARDRGRNSRLRAAIRPQAERFHGAVEGERSRVQPGGRRSL